MSDRRSIFLKVMAIAIFIFLINSTNFAYASDKVLKVAPTLMRLKSNGVTVMWEVGPNDNCRLEIDTDKYFLNPLKINLGQRAIFRLIISILEPNTTYYYKVFSNIDDRCWNQ